MSNPIEIYTDGACSGNPGPGGWGALLRWGSLEKELSGFDPQTTNNRMELKAAIEALKSLKQACSIDLYTDSTYVRDGITLWIKGWQKNGWRTAGRKPVKNADLWVELLELTHPHEIRWHWVRGHNDHPENERVDTLARLAIIEALTNKEF